MDQVHRPRVPQSRGLPPSDLLSLRRPQPLPTGKLEEPLSSTISSTCRVRSFARAAASSTACCRGAYTNRSSSAWSTPCVTDAATAKSESGCSDPPTAPEQAASRKRDAYGGEKPPEASSMK